MRRYRAEHGRNSDLDEGPRYRDASHREEFFQVELEPDTEHQEYHADLRQLARYIIVCRVSEHVAPEENARHHIPDYWRESDPTREETKRQRRYKSSSQGEDQVE